MENDIRNQDPGAGCVLYSQDDIASRSSQRTELEYYVCTLTCLYTKHISTKISICMHLYLYQAKHEVILMSPTYIRNHRVILAFYLSSVISHFNSEKPGFHQLSSTYLFVQSPSTNIVVLELLTKTPLGNNFTNKNMVFMYIVAPLIFSLISPLIS